jgi:hypothetical protein
MKTDSEFPVRTPPAEPPLKQRFLGWPATRLGWWSVGLGAAYFVLSTINTFVFMPSKVEIPGREVILPFCGIFMLLCGLAAGVTGLVAVIWRRERSWIVWLTMVPRVFVLFLVIGEFLVPH